LKIGFKHNLRQPNNSHIVFDASVICTENRVKILLAPNEEICDLTLVIRTMFAA